MSLISCKYIIVCKIRDVARASGESTHRGHRTSPSTTLILAEAYNTTEKIDKDYSQKVSGLGLKCYPAQPSRRALSVSLFPLMEKVKPWENVSVAAVYPSHITCHTQRTTHNVPPLPNMAVNLGPAVKPRRLTYLATALGLDSLLETDNFLLCKKKMWLSYGCGFCVLVFVWHVFVWKL